MKKGHVYVSKLKRGHYVVQAMNKYGDVSYAERTNKPNAIKEANRIKRQMRKNPVNIF